MKLVFFCRLFYPHVGGVEKHVMEISRRLINRGYEITIITEQIENTSLEEQKNGIHIYRIQVGKNDCFKKFRVWKKMWGLRKVIKKTDIVHCHDIFFWYLPFRFLYFNKPIYTTFHGFEGYPIMKRAIVVRKIAEKLSYGNICIGEYLKKWYGTRANLVSYGAVDLVKGASYNIPAHIKKVKLCFVGRIEKDTGIPVYLEAFKLLKEKKIPFTFEAFGDGSLRNQVEMYGKVHGFVNDKEVTEGIKRNHILLVSSYLSSMEAFSNMRNVISVFDNPLKEDILKMTPWAKWVVITNDPQKVCDVIINFQNDTRNFRKNALASYNWVQKQTWDKATENYLKLWKLKII